MQVEVDMKYAQTNFDGHGLSGFGVMAPFYLPSKAARNSFLLHYMLYVANIDNDY